jgi:putative ABC transport system substrate-binding protein
VITLQQSSSSLDEDRMDRRDFIAAATVLVLSPRRSWAQGAPRRVCYLNFTPKTPLFSVFQDSLRAHGWIEGKNVIIDEHSAEGHAERVPPLAAELVALKPDVLVGAGPQVAVALKSATASIPIVFLAVYDPVAMGLVQSLSHPGGNITGLASVVPGGMIGKEVELLRELVPGAAKIALLVNPENPVHRQLLAEEIPRTARTMGVALPAVEASKAEELDIAFASAVAQQADAIIVFGDNLVNQYAARVTALAATHRLPAVYLFRQFAPGGLIVYGPDVADLIRRTGDYVDKILRGAKPAELPVEQPTKFELVININAAKALGLAVPPSLLVRADEIIE